MRLGELLGALSLATDLAAGLPIETSLGHSTEMAALVEAACEDREAMPRARVAALLHDLGTVSVPNGIWDKPGPLGAMEWERVRLHARGAHAARGRGADPPRARRDEQGATSWASCARWCRRLRHRPASWYGCAQRSATTAPPTDCAATYVV